MPSAFLAFSEARKCRQVTTTSGDSWTTHKWQQGKCMQEQEQNNREAPFNCWSLQAKWILTLFLLHQIGFVKLFSLPSYVSRPFFFHRLSTLTCTGLTFTVFKICCSAKHLIVCFQDLSAMSQERCFFQPWYLKVYCYFTFFVQFIVHLFISFLCLNYVHKCKNKCFFVLDLQDVQNGWTKVTRNVLYCGSKFKIGLTIS